jgi:hypothetical protein
VIALEGRLHWRKVAPYHIQIEVQKSPVQFRLPDSVEISGRVVRVFRTDGRLATGDHVAFQLWVCRPGEEPTGPAYVYYEDFIQTTHIEVYLHGIPPKCELAAYEFTILNGASDEPTMSAEQLEEELRSAGEVPKSGGLGTSDPKAWWQFWKNPPRLSKQSDWLTKLHEPFFRTGKDAEEYVMRELSLAVSEGWRITRPPGERLTWVIKKEKLEPGEWHDQDYCVRISNGLDFLILIYGNKDVGPFGIEHALHNALVIEAVMLRGFRLSACLRFLFAHCKANEWGYT